MVFWRTDRQHGGQEGAMDILLLGMGNILKTDDGLGVHAVRRLAEEGLEGADLLELGASLVDSFFLLEAYDCIVALDAVHFGGKPGALCWLGREELARVGRAELSLHEGDLLDALDLAALRGKRPALYVAGMEPYDITSWGMELSSPVRAALSAYLAMVREKVHLLALSGKHGEGDGGGGEAEALRVCGEGRRFS